MSSLFSEPMVEAEVVHLPQLFLDIVQRWWMATGVGANPSTLDKRLYNVGHDLSKALQVPAVDGLMAALTGPSVVADPPQDAL